MQVIPVDLSSAWKSHIPSDGSNIGGVDPVSYGATLVPGKKPSQVLSISGNSKPPGYPAWMSYPPQPIPFVPPVKSVLLQLTLCFKLWVDARMQAASNCLETDSLFVIDGKHYNGSAQVVTATGELQVGTGTGGWQSTGVKVPAFSPNVKHDIMIIYSIDTVKETISVLAYVVDGTVYTVPVEYQNQSATPLTWTPGIYLQLQQGSLPAGNPWSARFSDISYFVQD